MKIIYLYSVCIATLLIACEEGRNEVKERKLTVDNAVNTDAIQSPIATKEHTLEEYPSEKKQPISEPKVEKKARLATKDSFSQTSTKSDVQPLALFPIIPEVALVMTIMNPSVRLPQNQVLGLQLNLLKNQTQTRIQMRALKVHPFNQMLKRRR